MGYKDQFIWQKAIKLSVRCYKLTNYFPDTEKFGMISQIRRCSVSVASNIAEGYGRKGKGEYLHFLHIALGSLRELDTQLIISKEVELARESYIQSVLEDCDEMQKLVKSTINTLSKKPLQPSAVSRQP